MSEPALKIPFVKPAIKKISLASTNKFTGSYLKVTTVNDVFGHGVRKLLKAHGSPLYVISEEVLVRRFREMLGAFRKHYAPSTIAYSYKTNYLSTVCAILHREGAWAEVVSGFEYEIARQLGMPGPKIVFNGPYKTPSELKRAFLDQAM
ncbi:MAG: diaminopimelate decarboxylase, partial [Desulfobacteraceae bacterium]